MTRFFFVEFDFKFKHKKGTSNQAANALSRKGKHAALCMLAPMHSSKIDASMHNIIREFIQKDHSGQAVVALAKVDKTGKFWVEEDLLTKGNIFYMF